MVESRARGATARDFSVPRGFASLQSKNRLLCTDIRQKGMTSANKTVPLRALTAAGFRVPRVPLSFVHHVRARRAHPL